MRYVALLRGVNVGGASKVSMADLRMAFEEAGMTEVTTYINSGNVIFCAEDQDRSRLPQRLENAVRAHSGVSTDIQLRILGELESVVEAIPDAWVNDGTMKCDVVFLQPDVDRPEIVDELGPRPGIEDARYVPGALIWRVDRKDATRSRLSKMVGTPLYRRVTVRNCNTARKLLAMLRG